MTSPMSSWPTSVNYFNRGTQTGEPLEEFRFGCEDCSTYGVAVGDLNGDGFPEIITANSGAPNVIFASLPASGEERRQSLRRSLRGNFFFRSSYMRTSLIVGIRVTISAGVTR